MEPLVLHSRSPAQTRRIGARLGKLLRAGDVLLLQGELGSGKTTLTQGLGAGMKVAEPVKSSSFVLLNEYHGRLTVYHADLFRLNEPEEVADLALEEVAAPGVLVVEWPERAWEELPPKHLLVRIEEEDVRGRRLTLTARGQRYKELLAQLARPSAGRGRKKRVLFVCTHNAARSQMAEAWLRHLYSDHYEAASAGTEASRVHPLAVLAMAEEGVDISRQQSKMIGAFAGEAFDLAITVCDDAREACPFVPGAAEQLHWSLPDPAEAKGSEEERLAFFRTVRDEIRRRVEATFG